MSNNIISISISDDTLEKLQKLANIKDFLLNNGETTSVEDLIKASIHFYLSRFYSDTSPEITTQLLSLGTDYPLKNRFKEHAQENTGLLANHIANQTKIPKNTISNIFNNNNQPSLDHFLRIWVLLGCPPLERVLYREVPNHVD